MKLRRSTNKYFFMCKAYREQDRVDLTEVAKKFAEAFGIGYEKISVKGHHALFKTDDSDFYGNATNTTSVETWLIVKWAMKYGKVEFYDSPHVVESLIGGSDESKNT